MKIPPARAAAPTLVASAAAVNRGGEYEALALAPPVPVAVMVVEFLGMVWGKVKVVVDAIPLELAVP